MNSQDFFTDPAKCSFICDPSEAAQWFEAVGRPNFIAFDLEADGLHRYEDKVCLAQVSTRETCAILDPLGDKAVLAPLLSLLADPTVKKLLHGGDYDVRLLKKDQGVSVVNLFDTMIASQLLGRKLLGLGALVEEEFGVKLDKRHQRADWSRRPLTEDMLAYAACDVVYLPELAARLERELERLGRMRWAREEFLLLEQAPVPQPRTPSALDQKGAQKLPPDRLAILQYLLELRDLWARKWDKPSFKVLPADLLIAWSENPPKTRREIIDAPGANKGALAKLADGVMEALEKAKALTPDQWPRRERKERHIPGEEEKKRLKDLKAARDKTATALGLEPGILVNGATLEKLARLEKDEALAQMPSMLKNWQNEAVGDSLLEMLKGE